MADSPPAEASDDLQSSRSGQTGRPMFVGHYGVAFAVKTERNRIPLWVLFVAVQLLDFLWAPFVLLGIEKVRMVPGITATNSLDLYYMPYTHSLVGALIWSGAAFLIYKLVVGQKASKA